MTDTDEFPDDFDYVGFSKNLREIPCVLPTEPEKLFNIHSIIAALQFGSGLALKPVVYTAGFIGGISYLTTKAGDSG